MTFSKEEVEKINFFRTHILNLSLERIFDHDFETKEVLMNNHHHLGYVGITVDPGKDNGSVRYNMKSLKFSRENKVLTDLYNLEGIGDVVFTHSKNLMLLYDQKYIKKLINSDKFKNLEVGVETIDKFNL